MTRNTNQHTDKGDSKEGAGLLQACPPSQHLFQRFSPHNNSSSSGSTFNTAQLLNFSPYSDETQTNLNSSHTSSFEKLELALKATLSRKLEYFSNDGRRPVSFRTEPMEHEELMEATTAWIAQLEQNSSSANSNSNSSVSRPNSTLQTAGFFYPGLSGGIHNQSTTHNQNNSNATPNPMDLSS